MTKKKNKGGGGGAAEDGGGHARADVPSTACNRHLDGFQNDVIHRSTVAQHGWWHTEDFKIHHVVGERKFWTGIWQHLVFPLVWINHRENFAIKFKKLECNPVTRKLAKNAIHKARDYLAVYLIFCISWLISIYYGQGGACLSDISTSAAVVKNVSLILPLLVYIFFYSGISLICTAHHAILFRRGTAVPPTLLLADEFDGTRYDDDIYHDEKLLKTKAAFSGYQEWEEGFESFYVEEMLSSGSCAGGTSGNDDKHDSPDDSSDDPPMLACALPPHWVQQKQHKYHGMWRQRMIGSPDAESVTRIREWLAHIHRRARSGNIWRLVWYPLVFFNCLHIAWPIGLTALEMQSGRAGTLALLLTVLQSGASGYAWHNGLRLSLLAVMHFSRLRTISGELTQLVAIHLRLKAETECAGEVLDTSSIRDWWRLRVLLTSASTTFSNLYWLHFTCILLANIILSICLIPSVALYDEHLQMRYLVPMALNNVVICFTIASVLYFCLFANEETHKQIRALTARRIELWVNQDLHYPQVEQELKMLADQLEANPLGLHRLLGIAPITTNIVLKMLGFLASGPLVFVVRWILRTRQERASAGYSFF